MPRICIVGGCGRMGLPLGIRLAESGARVALLDRDEQRVRAVQAGQMPHFEPAADRSLRTLVEQGNLRASSESKLPRDQDAVIVAIGTPIDEHFNPEPSVVLDCCRALLEQMSDGQLLMLRSTVLPGTTDRVAAEAIAHGRRINVAYCPDRTTEGNAFDELRSLPQIVAGTSAESASRAARIFESLQVPIVELSPLEAELGKLFTNSYRYITFAIANQLYGIAQRHGADFERIRGAITRDYPRMQGFPRAGLAAGPCLMKDTVQLASFDFVRLSAWPGGHDRQRRFSRDARRVGQGAFRSIDDDLRHSRHGVQRQHRRRARLAIV